jgi:hypothetical protein
MNQSLATQKQKTLSAFQVWRARHHSFGSEAMVGGPPNMKCFKRIYQYQKKREKKKLNFFYVSDVCYKSVHMADIHGCNLVPTGALGTKFWH